MTESCREQKKREREETDTRERERENKRDRPKREYTNTKIWLIFTGASHIFMFLTNMALFKRNEHTFNVLLIADTIKK